MKFYSIPSHIFIYPPENKGLLNFDEINNYVKEKFRNIEAEIRESFFEFIKKFMPEKIWEERLNYIARRIVEAKIMDDRKKVQENVILPKEIEYEIKFIGGETKSTGIMYDGVKLSLLYREFIPEKEKNWSYCHILFTNRLIGTWDENDRRYHARASIYAFPSIISVTGIVTAPAKPREFYIDFYSGKDVNIIKEKYRGRFIDYGDKRMTEIVKGYIMQAIFFHITGEAFCKDVNCRLFNAHWQEELITSQIKSKYEFCNIHRKMLEEINERKN